MKKSIATTTILFFLVNLPLVFALNTDWFIESANASVQFVIKNAGFNVNGTLGNLKGKIVFDENDLANSRIEATVEANTIDTGINLRDNNLKKEDYFDVANYPTIQFSSTKIEKRDSGYLITGTFTIKKTTKTVQIPFTFERNTFSGKFEISRKDYGVGKSSWIMADKVKISFEIPVKKAG